MGAHAVTVGLGQMRVDPGEEDRNLARAEAVIAQAADQGVDVLVLPECLDLGWTYPGARAAAEPIPGPRSERLSRAARAAGLYVVAGLTERAGAAVYNAAVLLGPDGSVLLVHRKINELEIAEDLYDVGDRLGVAHTPLGTFGVSICADNVRTSLAIGHVLARMGAQILLSPSAWAVPPDYDPVHRPYGATWLEPYTELARLYDIAVIGVSSVGPMTTGPWAGHRCIGASLAVGPGGYVLARGPYGEAAEALMVVSVPLRPPAARGTGWARHLAARGYHGP